MSTFRRIGLWFCSLLLSIAVFSVLFNLIFNRPGFFPIASVLLIFRITLKFALPVWCLYLPFVLALKDAEDNRLWTILGSGVLIGPAAIVLWGALLQVAGGDSSIWRGDPLAFGSGGAIIFALMVGFLATSFYLIALKVLHHLCLAR